MKRTMMVAVMLGMFGCAVSPPPTTGDDGANQSSIDDTMNMGMGSEDVLNPKTGAPQLAECERIGAACATPAGCAEVNGQLTHLPCGQMLFCCLLDPP